MIFVTVGTHEQQFNRLVEYMDNWASKHDEELIIQSGYSTYEPRHCKWKSLFSYQEMSRNVADARIVITHGGPSSFIAPIQIGKTPIVVPRRYCFDEHVNDHQVNFCKEVESRMGIIKVVDDIDTLEDVIDNYDEMVGTIGNRIRSNNAEFCKQLDKIVNGLFEDKR